MYSEAVVAYVSKKRHTMNEHGDGERSCPLGLEDIKNYNDTSDIELEPQGPIPLTSTEYNTFNEFSKI